MKQYFSSAEWNFYLLASAYARYFRTLEHGMAVPSIEKESISKKTARRQPASGESKI